LSCLAVDQGMVPRKRIKKAHLKNLAKANAVKATNLDNFQG
jgi:hypothetical protein